MYICIIYVYVTCGRPHAASAGLGHTVILTHPFTQTSLATLHGERVSEAHESNSASENDQVLRALMLFAAGFIYCHNWLDYFRLVPLGPWD